MIPVTRERLLVEKRNQASEYFNVETGLVYFLDCSNSKFVVEGTPSKIILENCQESQVVVRCDKVRTGCLEVISCSKLELEVKVSKGGVPTIVTEKSENIWFKLEPVGFSRLYSCQSRDLSVSFMACETGREEQKKEGQRLKVEYPQVGEEEARQVGGREALQFVTTRKCLNSKEKSTQSNGDELLTEVVLREGSGYMTTKTEKVEQEEKDQLSRKCTKDVQNKTNDETVNKLQTKDVSTQTTMRFSFLTSPKFPEPKRKGNETVEEKAENFEKKFEKVEKVEPEKRKEIAGSLLSDVSRFSKTQLRPTTTVIKDGTTVIVNSGGNSFDAELVQEWEDSEEVLEQKVQVLKEVLQSSLHVVAFTGAGISTSAKIPDYRGPQGVWTLQDQGKTPLERPELSTVEPTFAHQALKELLDRGVIKHIVSTNVDGLHRRSGVKREDLSELHGNAFIERCSNCGAEYVRDFDCIKGGQRSDHVTGRQCEKENCKGALVDSIVNFGEQLPTQDYKNSEFHSKECDVSLVLGTSMRVAPACTLPTYAYKKPNGKMVICNLQKTPFDKYAYLRIFANTDVVMEKLMTKLANP